MIHGDPDPDRDPDRDIYAHNLPRDRDLGIADMFERLRPGFFWARSWADWSGDRRGVTAISVDGCRAGWVAALAREDIADGRVRTELRLIGHEDGGFESLVAEYGQLKARPCIAVDVPIGLPMTAGLRVCDRQAQAKIARRWMCVFPVPDRELFGRSFEEAREIVQARRLNDPDGDHHRLTHELSGRRINLAIPADSLLLQKACGKVPHTGGQKIKEGDEYYAAITRWLEADAPLDPPTVASPTGIEVYPPSAVLDGISAEMQASGVDMGAVEEPLPEEPITGEPVLEGAVQASPTAGVDRETMETMVQANRDDGNRAG